MSDAPSGEHSELMDRVYRHQRHIYDLTRKYYLFGRDRVIRNLGLRSGDKLVEVGCGTARNLIAIGHRYSGVQLYGLDASHEMLRTAQENVRKTQRGNQAALNVAISQGYAEDMDSSTFGPGAAPFDRALFSYSLSMIPDWRGALAAAASVLKPDGLIDIVDFGDLASLGPLAGGALRGWLKLFHVEPRAEILGAVEPAARDLGGELWISPGRYAFSWRCTARDLARLGLSAVASK
jgi:S-adenosylmethionine-diacylgycerolhomoserine-N-methlytransferase